MRRLTLLASLALACPAAAGEPKPLRVLLDGDGRETVVAFSPDGKTLAAARGGRAVLLDRATGRVGATLLRPDAIRAAAFSPDGHTLALGDWGGAVTLWEAPWAAPKAELAARQGAVWSLAFSPDGRTLAAGATRPEVVLWDVPGRRERRRLAGHDNAVMAVAFSPDGKTLASASLDTSVRLWDPASGEVVAYQERVLRFFLGGELSPVALAYSPDGRRLAVGVSLLDADSLREVDPSETVVAGGAAAAFSPGGRFLARDGGESVVVLHARSQREALRLRGHDDDVTSLAFSPDGKALAAGTEGGAVLLWDVSGLPAVRDVPGLLTPRPPG
jgi:WD40 repeat protein